MKIINPFGRGCSKDNLQLTILAQFIENERKTIMNKVYTHPGQPQMQVEVILASKAQTSAKPLYTVRMRYPRCIHGEIMTHRVFSRNARSSRAVPVGTMLKEVRETPYIPWHWGKNQKGMQADEECTALVDMTKTFEASDIVEHSAPESWKLMSEVACDAAEAFMNAGYHKQNPNRLLEPFSWMDTLVTSTEWKNFFWLRQHRDAEPHLQDLADLVHMAIQHTKPEPLSSPEWHLPYIGLTDRAAAWTQYGLEVYSDEYYEWLRKISAARCARISYAPFDGDASYEKELARYDQLVSSDRVHASPTEHQARPDTFHVSYGGYVTWNNPNLHGNLNGYIQARKLIPNEAVM